MCCALANSWRQRGGNLRNRQKEGPSRLPGRTRAESSRAVAFMRRRIRLDACQFVNGPPVPGRIAVDRSRLPQTRNPVRGNRRGYGRKECQFRRTSRHCSGGTHGLPRRPGRGSSRTVDQARPCAIRTATRSYERSGRRRGCIRPANYALPSTSRDTSALQPSSRAEQVSPRQHVPGGAAARRDAGASDREFDLHRRVPVASPDPRPGRSPSASGPDRSVDPRPPRLAAQLIVAPAPTDETNTPWLAIA